MNETVARFQSQKQYYIVGIGHILTGQTVGGSIEYGNQIRLQSDNTEIIYTITDVQLIEYMTSGTSETALILELTQGNPENNYLENIAGEVISIVK
ncbi:hypothetical protein GCM10027037_18280 [Mucilaginibacter koreensis]